MCPENARMNCHHQQGFLMPLALFILVGLGALAIAVARLGAGQHSAATQEALSVQAFYAAESARQYGLHRVLFNAMDPAAADAGCSAIHGHTMTFAGRGLGACSATLECIAESSAHDPVVVYRVSVNARCGSGDFAAERSLATAVRHE